MIPDDRASNATRSFKSFAIDLLVDFENNVDVLQVRVPVNIFYVPFSEQAVDIALGVECYQLCSFVGKVRVVTVNFQRNFLLNAGLVSKKERDFVECSSL